MRERALFWSRPRPRPVLSICSAPSLSTSPTSADFGREDAVRIEGLGKADITKQLEDLVKRGESYPRSTESEGEVAAA